MSSNRFVDRIVEEGLERFKRFQERDAEFERHFGRWRRPKGSPSYPIETWGKRIRWDPMGEGIIDCSKFVKSFPDKVDQVLVAEIAKFVVEAYEDRFCTDTTLNTFRLDLLSRLETIGY